jgi:hypothetical protein
MDGWME